MGEPESLCHHYGMSKEKIKEKTDEAFRTLGMENLRNVLVKEIPLGWKQKLAFTAATLHAPDIVFWMSRRVESTRSRGVSSGK